MRLTSLLILAAGILALAGCSSTPAKVDHGSIRARTFSFVDTGAKTPPTYADNRQIIHPMIQEAITRTLSGRGVTRVASGGDITVGYLVIVGDNAATTSINDYFGYGEDASALHEKAHEAYTKSKNPNYFEAGTLVIDLVDSKSFKLLKRGYATRPVLRNLPNDARAARIQEVVDEILRGVRFGP
jgi:hypothetical protein